MNATSRSVWCWALGPKYIESRVRTSGLPVSTYVPAPELVDYFHCRNVALFPGDEHYAAGNFTVLSKYDRVMAEVYHVTEEGRARARELSRLSLQCPNLVGGIIDDFSSAISRNTGTPADLRKLARDLKSANPALKLYAVCYTMHFGVDLSAYLQDIDAISLWVWEPAHLKDLDAHIAEATRLYRKPIHLGLYLFDYSPIDFSRKDPDYWANALKTLTLPMETLQFQCERARQYLKDGRIEAIHILGCYARDELKTDQARWLADFVGSL